MHSFDPEWVSYEEAHPIVVPDELQSAHPITVKTAANWSSARALALNKHAMGRDWKLKTFKIRVSYESADRALRIVDALAKACEARGFGFGNASAHDDSAGLAVIVDGEMIELVLAERMARSPYQPTKQELRLKERGEYVY